MYFTFIGIVVLIITVCLFLFTRTRTLFYFTFFISAFTATSMINFPKSRNSVLCYYIVGSFLILKVIYELVIRRYTLKKIKILNGLFYFMVYVTISLILPIVYSNNTLVFTPDSPFTYISFSSQNITQYIYLLFAFIIYLASYIVFTNEIKVDIKKMINVTSFAVIILGFLQFFMNHIYFDLIFRTNYSHLVQYLETGLTRISSVTNEPSMLALFVTPISVYYFINIINGFKKKNLHKFDIVIFVMIIITSLLNRSSSFYLAIAIIFIVLIIDFLREIFNKKNKEFIQAFIMDKVYKFIKENRIKSTIITIILLAIFLILFKIVGHRFLILGLKLLGLDDSGSTRMELFSYHMGIFLKNLFTGVGFGTLRSNDLLSMWCAQVGLIGIVPIIYYFTSRFIYLFKTRNDGDNRSVLYLILTSVIILVTSVPEPYFIYVWIYIALGEALYNKKEISNKTIDKLNQEFNS